MGDGIQIDQQIVEANAQVITDMSLYFKENPLGSEDLKTTITANQNSKDSYVSAQALIAVFGKAMDQEANNITKDLESTFV